MKKFFVMLSAFVLGMFSLAQTHAATGDFVNLMNTTTQGGIDNVPSIMATPLGGYIYLVIAMLILFTIVWIVIAVIKWGKINMSGGKGKSRGRGRKR